MRRRVAANPKHPRKAAKSPQNTKLDDELSLFDLCAKINMSPGLDLLPPGYYIAGSIEFYCHFFRRWKPAARSPRMGPLAKPNVTRLKGDPVNDSLLQLVY